MTYFLKERVLIMGNDPTQRLNVTDLSLKNLLDDVFSPLLSLFFFCVLKYETKRRRREVEKGGGGEGGERGGMCERVRRIF